jgi:uridine phosphorylase
MEYLETRSEIMLFPYAAASDTSVLKAETPSFQRCITVSSPGFYAPQNRKIRLPLAEPKMIELLKKFRFEGKVISGYSTDTAPVLGLGRALNHNVGSYSIIVSNIITGEILDAPEGLKAEMVKAIFELL